MEQRGSEASAALFRRGLNQIDMHQYWVSESHICPPCFLLPATQFRKPVALQSMSAIPVLGTAGGVTAHQKTRRTRWLAIASVSPWLHRAGSTRRILTLLAGPLVRLFLRVLPAWQE